MFSRLVLVLLALAVVHADRPAAGARPRCVVTCREAVAACVATGGRRATCRRSLVRRCRRGDAAACSAATTTTTGHPVTTTTLTAAGCCGPVRMVLETRAEGHFTLVPPGLPLPLPSGIGLVLDVGEPDLACRHPVRVPAGGFSVPVWCAEAREAVTGALAVDPRSGACTGSGTFWDRGAGAPPARVRVLVDRSAAGACPPDAACPGIGAAATLDDGDAGTVAGLNLRLDLPVVLRSWRQGHDTSVSRCPDPDGVPQVGTDRDIDVATTTLHLSTATARVGSAQDGPACTATDQAAATGAPAPGYCCTPGQQLTLAAAGVLRRPGVGVAEAWALTVPAVVAACVPLDQPATCTTPDLECDPGAVAP